MEVQKWINSLQAFKRAESWIEFISIDQNGQVYGYLNMPIRQINGTVVPQWFSYIQYVQLERLPAIPAGIDRSKLVNSIWRRSGNIWTAAEL